MEKINLGISLIFVGITLILNGIDMLNPKKSNKDLIIINLFTSLLIFLFNFKGLLSIESQKQAIGNLGGLLFGLTNLLVAFDIIFKTNKKVTGVYCGLSFVLAVSLGIFYILNAETLLGVLWLVWSLIWLFIFFAVIVTDKMKTSASIMLMCQGALSTLLIGMLTIFQIIKI